MNNNIKTSIREAMGYDHDFIVDLMVEALGPYYGGNHEAHAERIFNTHISGGIDQVGHFSFEQRIFIISVNDEPGGMVNIVGKRQGTYKISPIIISKKFQGNSGLGSILLTFVEDYAKKHNARQIYCTVAKQNSFALNFFLKKGYIIAGLSDSHYKAGITELMLYKPFYDLEFEEYFDKPNISVLPMEGKYGPQVRNLILETLPSSFNGVDDKWVAALFQGYKRRSSGDINLKYKLIFIAIDRKNSVLGVVGATPKKGKPIKIMPLIAKSQQAFFALLNEIPFFLNEYGRKLYIHITPTAEETIFLQQSGWHLDSAMPSAYQNGIITQQWSLDISGEHLMRLMRVKRKYFDFIKNGTKTLEVRVGYDNIKRIRPGEKIRLACRDATIIIYVNDVRNYSTFEEMLKKENPQLIAPELSGNEVLNIFKEIYPPHLEKLGVFVLDISVEK